MAPRKPKGSKRIHRFSQKQSVLRRRLAHPGRVVALVLTAVLSVTAALVLGTYLSAKSDAYREEQSKGQWTLEEIVPPCDPSSAPPLRQISIRPEGNVGDILIAGKHDGVILPLQDVSGGLNYTSSVANAAGLSTAPVSLTADVSRVRNRGLNVTCVFTVTWATETTPSLRAYKRGMELALLREYAESGMNDLLLLGLPAGSETLDRMTVEFLQELSALLSDLQTRPAVGVGLSPVAFATDETYTPPMDPSADAAAGIPEGKAPLYAGNITPSRIAAACDYLAMDLRDKTPDEVGALLPHIRYVYTRHSLRLLLDQQDEDTLRDALSHGFTGIFEMDAPVTTSEEAHP